MSLRALIMGSSGTYIPDLSVQNVIISTISGTSRKWYGLSYGKFDHLLNADGSLQCPNGIFAVVAYGTNIAAYSLNNCESFTEVNIPSNVSTATNPYAAANWRNVACGKRNGVDTFIAVPYSGGTNGTITKSAWSSNGKDWNFMTLPAGNWHTIGYGNGTWVILPISGTSSLISSDGVNWTLLSGLPSGQWNDITYTFDSVNNIEKFVAVSISGKIATLKRTAGGSWAWESVKVVTSPSGAAPNYYSVAANETGKIIAISNNYLSNAYYGAISTDYGNSYTPFAIQQPSGAILAWYAIQYADGIWIMSTGSYVSYSTTGEPGTWGIYKYSTTSNYGGYSSSAYANNRYCFTAEGTKAVAFTF